MNTGITGWLKAMNKKAMQTAVNRLTCSTRVHRNQELILIQKNNAVKVDMTQMNKKSLQNSSEHFRAYSVKASEWVEAQ